MTSADGVSIRTDKVRKTSKYSLSLALVLREHGGLMIALAVLILLAVFFAPHFATYQNMLNISRQLAFTGIIALGMTLVIVAGEIDISVGSAIAFSSSLLGVIAIKMGVSLPLSVLVVLGCGLGIGLAAGFARSYLNIPSFIVTIPHSRARPI